MKRKLVALLLPIMAMSVSGCGGEKPCEHIDEKEPWHFCDKCNEKISDHYDNNNDGFCDLCGEDLASPGSRELNKFNELVASIKSTHNYRLDIVSEVEGWDVEDNYYDNWTSYNGLAIETKDFEYGLQASGKIYQKDQGFVKYYREGDTIVPERFVSTNPDIKLYDFNEVIAENLFLGEFKQDETDKTKFVTVSKDSIAVGCQFTGFGDYVQVGVLQADTSLSAYVNIKDNQITIKMNFWLMYFDVVEHNDKALLTIVIKDIGKVEDSAIQAYIDSPTHTFSNPTEWSESDKYYFDLRFNGYYPVLPTGLSFSYLTELDYYDGFEYAFVTDKASGDLTNSYGAQLVNDGFSKVNENTYQKLTDGTKEFEKITYKVILKYYEPSIVYPKGVMQILYRATNDIGTFASIEEFNRFLSINKYDELVPTLPSEASVTKINNFKNQIVGSEDVFVMKINSTDTFHIYIEDYAKAKSFYEAYSDALVKKGYSEIQTGFGTMHNHGLATSTSGSYVAIDFPEDSSKYLGWIGIRYIVYKADEQSLRPVEVNKLVSIEISGMTLEYKVGDAFFFDGVCIATYEDESFKSVTPTYVSAPDMTSAGTKEVIVKYKENDIEKQKTYEITVKPVEKTLENLVISGFYNTQFIVGKTFDHSGMLVTVYYNDGTSKIVSGLASFSGYDMSKKGIQTVVVSYTESGVTVSESYQILLSEENYVWPALSMKKNEDVTLFGFYDDDNYEIEIFNYNQHQSFTASFYTLANVKSVSILQDEDAEIECTYSADFTYEYLIKPSKTLGLRALTLVVETDELTKYDITLNSNIEHGSLDLDGVTKAPFGGEVYIYVTPEEDYALNSIYVVNHPEIEINYYSSGDFYWFVMINEDVEIMATFNKLPPKHNVSAVPEQDLENGRVSIYFGSKETRTGETAFVNAYPADKYQTENVYIVDHPEIEVTLVSGTKWSFVMPDYDVVIGASFKPIPKVLSSISVSGQKSEFKVGESFSVGDLVVTAHFANGDSEIISSGYSVDSSAVDMQKAGSYTVTVSYTLNEVTKSVTYGVIVKTSDVTTKTYVGNNGDYSYVLNINSDGTGLYVLTRDNKGVISTYNQYFNWTEEDIGTIDIAADQNLESKLCTLGNYNLWFYWSGDEGSYKNTITLDGEKASFIGQYSNGTKTDRLVELTIEK